MGAVTVQDLHDLCYPERAGKRKAACFKPLVIDGKAYGAYNMRTVSPMVTRWKKLNLDISQEFSMEKDQ